jgi:hypothetical protein
MTGGLNRRPAARSTLEVREIKFRLGGARKHELRLGEGSFE